MRKALLIMLFGVGAYLLAKKEIASYTKGAQVQDLEQNDDLMAIPSGPDLTVVVNQDVSGSRLEYGVELASAYQFQPYYLMTTRNISLVFTLINDTSIGRPLQVFLERKTFIAPQIAAYVDNSQGFSDRRNGKLEFERAKKQYIVDSLAFFKKRDSVFRIFSGKVDSLVSIYREQPAPLTDIGTSIETDRKILQMDQNPTSKRFVIMLSDGKDNRNEWKSVQKLPAKVILVNSGPAIKIPIDRLIDIRLATLDNAIQYSLTQ